MIDAATILVADDSPDDVELLKRALQKAGLRNPVRYLSDGKEAIEYLSRNPDAESVNAEWPLLLLLDLNMPRCSGLGVLDWIRQQPHLNHLPIIVFANSDHARDVEECLRRGAHGYWVKPSRFEDLVQMMVRLKELLAKIVSKLEVSYSQIPLAA